PRERPALLALAELALGRLHLKQVAHARAAHEQVRQAAARDRGQHFDGAAGGAQDAHDFGMVGVGVDHAPTVRKSDSSLVARREARAQEAQSPTPSSATTAPMRMSASMACGTQWPNPTPK